MFFWISFWKTLLKSKLQVVSKRAMRHIGTMKNQIQLFGTKSNIFCFNKKIIFSAPKNQKIYKDLKNFLQKELEQIQDFKIPVSDLVVTK